MTITAKEAFKLGFVTKLAQHGIRPTELVDAVGVLIEKQGAFAPLATLAGLGGVTVIAPAHIGSALGASAGGLTEDELDTLSEARKKYLIKRYRDLIRQRRAALESRLITQAKQEA